VVALEEKRFGAGKNAKRQNNKSMTIQKLF